MSGAGPQPTQKERRVNILDPKFRYTPAAKTDIRKTFARIRKEQAARQAAPNLRLARTASLTHPKERAA